MTNKLISSVLLAAAFPILEATPSHKNSLLFLFISNNKIVAAVRVAVILVMFALSFNYIRISSRTIRKIMFAGGLALMLFGSACLLQTSLGSLLYNYLKFLDMMVIFELGVVLASTSLLAHQHAPSKIKANRTTKRAKTSAVQPA